MPLPPTRSSSPRSPDHALGRAVAAHFPDDEGDRTDPVARAGSVLLVPEPLSKPIREQRIAELERLERLLGRLELLDVDVNAVAASLALPSAPATGSGRQMRCTWPLPSRLARTG